DRTQAVGRNAEPEAAVQLLAQQSHVLQIGQENPLGLVVRVAHVVAGLPALAGQLADARHDSSLENWVLGDVPESGAHSGGAALRQPRPRPSARFDDPLANPPAHDARAGTG